MSFVDLKTDPFKEDVGIDMDLNIHIDADMDIDTVDSKKMEHGSGAN